MPAETTNQSPSKDQRLQPDWAVPRSRAAVTLSLRQIMILLVYFAIASLLGRSLAETASPLSMVLLVIWSGCGICYLGIWLAFRLGRLAILGWIVFILGYLLITGSMLGLMTVPAVPIVIGVLIYLHIQHRRNQQNGLLWVLASAANRGFLLAPGVEVHAQQSIGTFRDRAHVLAVLLQEGKSLSEAIDIVPGVVPWDAPLLIQVGELMGQVDAGLREAASPRTRRDRIFRELIGRIGYILGVIGIAQCIVAFNAYFIVPKFEAICQDFGIDLPPATRLLIQSTRVFSDHAPWFGLAEFLGLVYLAATFGRNGWQGLPIVGRLFRLQHKSLILRALALAVEANQPLDRTLEVMAASYPSRRVRRKLQRALILVRTGTGWTAALDGVGLISPRDMGVLDAATRAGNLAWGLRTLAETGERRSAYRVQIGSHVAFLVALIGLGALVLSFAVAMFSPLVHLIERLAG